MAHLYPDHVPEHLTALTTPVKSQKYYIQSTFDHYLSPYLILDRVEQGYSINDYNAFAYLKFFFDKNDMLTTIDKEKKGFIY